MNARSFYIFHSNLAAYEALKKSQPELKAVWFDGASNILDYLLSVFHIEKLIVEEEILPAIQRLLSRHLTNSPQLEVVDSLAVSTEKNIEGEIAFAPSNDTHVHSFNHITSHVANYRFFLLDKHEGVTETLEKLQLPFQTTARLFDANQLPLLVLGNDWGTQELDLIYQFRRQKKINVCLQESVIHFGDRYKRMQWCDFPFIQGVVSIRHLDRDVYFLTGNPRYEGLSATPLPANDRVLINSNFTYGIYENIREQWIEDILAACKQTNVDYLIAKHPRDRGDFPTLNVRESRADSIHALLVSSSLLITRFSSLIHEGLALGRRVIYYNPHQEKMHYDFEPDGDHLIVATTKTELVTALERSRLTNISSPVNDEFFKSYAMRHHGSYDGKASLRVAQALEVVKNIGGRVGSPSPYPIDFMNRAYLELRRIKRSL